ncbi:NADase-type glycan-binding domain-containing protein [Flavobacterium silvaticum]|uniref:NAD glycohydrolase translocation F5/8 type C domain-containing protein n=1 Tax=Flavobacterium silvaticum TaxID=1852020 RepID=A0A972FXF7_9FLAO|nr:hypothetical protein [Flavobacterium silvaticum]NMH26631.1 hypothetical protein [Flavobacterium silvaticum]
MAIRILFLLISLAGFGQSVTQLYPELGALIDKSEKEEAEFIELKKQCDDFYNSNVAQLERSKLSKEQKKLAEKCDFEMESYWDVLGPGCSWYCGAGEDTISASSYLKSAKIDYSPKNIHDLDYKSAWIEGVKGYGIGEFVVYHFPPENPRITEIIVVNGYVKSAKLWKENSRVKKLKMYVDDNVFAVLNLSDSRNEQHFKIGPLGYSDRQNWDILKNKPWWTIKFEILEVYPGSKFEDTVITEIYFDGIDVH